MGLGAGGAIWELKEGSIKIGKSELGVGISSRIDSFVKKRFRNSISVEPKEGEGGIRRSYVVTAPAARSVFGSTLKVDSLLSY